MNIIEHLTRTVTPVLLNNATDENRSSLLEKFSAHDKKTKKSVKAMA